MKTTIKISKSAVMKRAWNIYRNNSNMFPTFSSALERAWAVEKANALRAIEIAEMEARKTTINRNVKFQFNPAAMESYYASSCYKGD